MIEGTTTGIEIATLIVAILAVLSTIAGIFISANLNSRSEHRTWKRDLRSQYYSALDDEVQNLRRTIAKSPSPSELEKREAFYLLYPKISNVTTYGTVSVRDAAFSMFKELSVAAVMESPWVNGDQIDEAIASYREAVRGSLKLDDE